MCTAINFIDKEGNLYFGRNLDWSCGYGEKIIITPKRYKPKSPFKAIKEIKYPVIGLGIVQEDVPLYFDCANDQGLAIAGLNFSDYAVYAKPEIIGPDYKIAAYEFPLWVTSQFSTVEELKKEILWNRAVIIDEPINDNYPNSSLHWIIADKEECIVVEQTKNDFEVFDNPFRVLANQPGFKWHEENLKNYLNLNAEVPAPIEGQKPYGSGGNMRGLPGDYYSPSRFVRAEYLNRNYPVKEGESENVNKMFHLLDSVSMIEGAALMTNGEFEKTFYSSCYCSKSNKYYRKNYNNDLITVELDNTEKDKKELIVY